MLALSHAIDSTGKVSLPCALTHQALRTDRRIRVARLAVYVFARTETHYVVLVTQRFFLRYRVALLKDCPRKKVFPNNCELEAI